MEARIALIVVVAAAVLIPVIIKMVSDNDYKRQIKGKRPMRQYKGANPPKDISDTMPSSKELEDNVQKLANEAELKIKSGQNLMGPM